MSYIKGTNMSHVTTTKTQIKSKETLATVCKKLGLSEPQYGTAKLYDGQTRTGEIVQLPGWRYPVVINTATGELHGDNYNGRWGDKTQLDKLVMHYGAEVVRREANRNGDLITEQQLADGSICIEIDTTVRTGG